MTPAFENFYKQLGGTDWRFCRQLPRWSVRMAVIARLGGGYLTRLQWPL